MNPGYLVQDLVFLSTLSDIDNPELLICLMTDVQVGGGREVLGQEALKEGLKAPFIS